MGLRKVEYIGGITVISANNLNDIQDAIIELEEKASEEDAGARLPEVDSNGILCF